MTTQQLEDRSRKPLKYFSTCMELDMSLKLLYIARIFGAHCTLHLRCIHQSWTTTHVV